MLVICRYYRQCDPKYHIEIQTWTLQHININSEINFVVCLTRKYCNKLLTGNVKKKKQKKKTV